MREFVWVRMWVNRSESHRNPHAEMSGERQRVPGRKMRFPIWLFSFSVLALQDLCHEISHRLRRSVLLLSGGVGAGSQCKSSIVRYQHTADGFHVYTVLKCQSREGVPEAVEADMLQPGVLQDLLMELYPRIRMIHLTRDRRGEHILVIWVLAVFLDQQVNCILRDRCLPDRCLYLRVCFKTGGMPNCGGFFCRTRRFDAGILDGFQVKSTRPGGKRRPKTAF